MDKIQRQILENQMIIMERMVFQNPHTYQDMLKNINRTADLLKEKNKKSCCDMEEEEKGK